MNQSYWQTTTKKKQLDKVTKDLQTDILIIGGGLSGVTLAYYLKDFPFKITVIDKDEIGSHTSSHTTGKISILHDLTYQDIVKHYDIHYANLYYQSNLKALHEIENIIKKENIDCDFKKNNAYIYTDDPQYVKKIRKEKQILASLKADIVDINNHLAGFGLKNQAIFHPLKYLFSILKICQDNKIDFYENSKATKIIRNNNSYKVKVNDVYITCTYLVHATRYPFIKKGLYFMKLIQQKQFVDTKEFNKDENSYLCVDHTFSQRPITNDSSLEISMNSSSWFAQDSIALRGIPYIGRLNKYDNEFIIYGFHKWGMTLSHVAARLISDLILDKSNAYENLYGCHYFSMSYSKKYLHQIIKNNEKGYINQRFETKDISLLEEKEGFITKINNHLVAVYKDSKGQIYYLSPYCPHLKGLVHFNKKSQTWDCSCHQSVYDAYGKLIEGPSLCSLKEIKRGRNL